MTNVLIARKIERLKARISKMESEIKELCVLCQHDWQVLDRGNDHDGYSMVEITWYETRKCKNCGWHETIQTSKSKAY